MAYTEPQPPLDEVALAAVLGDISAERQAQHDKWGEQNHEDGTGGRHAKVMANTLRIACQDANRRSVVTWAHILTEEVAEALAETDPDSLRTELIQVAAVAAAWAEAIDRRGAPITEPQPSRHKQLEELINQAVYQWRIQHDPASYHGPGMSAFVAAWLVSHGWGPRPAVSRERLVDHVARIQVPDAPVFDGVLLLNAESMADALVPFLTKCGIEVTDD